MGLAVRVPATVLMLLCVTWKLGASVRKGGLDPTATKVTDLLNHAAVVAIG